MPPDVSSLVRVPPLRARQLQYQPWNRRKARSGGPETPACSGTVAEKPAIAAGKPNATGAEFEPARDVAPLEIHGVRLGVTICEDVWNDKNFWPERLHHRDPVRELADQE